MNAYFEFELDGTDYVAEDRFGDMFVIDLFQKTDSGWNFVPSDVAAVVMKEFGYDYIMDALTEFEG